MDTRHFVRIAAVVIVATLLMTLVFAATSAFAAENTSTAATTGVGAAAPKATEAAPAEEKSEGAAEGAKAEKKEIQHTVGNPSPSQLADLRRAWDSIPGFDLLLVSILGLVATVGIIGFGAYKQMKI